MLAIGTRVRFLHTITEDASGDHPEFLLAKKGAYGTITDYPDADLVRNWWDHEGKAWLYGVTWDGFLKASFYANEGDDFEVVP